jgi:ABC-type uncharacterized transport system fused permease/ATPase subunit
MALGHVSGALTFFVSHYGALSGYRATVDRLYNFRTSALEYLRERKGNSPGDVEDIDKDLLEGLAQQGLPTQWPAYLGGLAGSNPTPPSAILDELTCAKRIPNSSSSEEGAAQGSNDHSGHGKPVVELKGATLCLPSGEVLLNDVNLSVPAGKCVLLCGREGSGKSTVLRSLAGIWPFAESKEMNGLEKCPSQDIILIPQKPRLPNSMSLRDAVTFPKAPDSFSDDDIITALKEVGLAGICDGELDRTLDVNSVLSGGEFQRLMVAHCLLSKPRCVLLDESMAHLSKENQIAMYTLLRSELVEKTGTSLVSTTHDWKDLMHFHDTYYMIQVDDSDGSNTSSRTLCEFQPCGEASSSAMPAKTESLESLHLKLAEKDEEIEKLKGKLASFVPPEVERPVESDTHGNGK